MKAILKELKNQTVFIESFDTLLNIGADIDIEEINKIDGIDPLEVIKMKNFYIIPKEELKDFLKNKNLKKIATYFLENIPKKKKELRSGVLDFIDQFTIEGEDGKKLEINKKITKATKTLKQEHKILFEISNIFHEIGSELYDLDEDEQLTLQVEFSDENRKKILDIIEKNKKIKSIDSIIKIFKEESEKAIEFIKSLDEDVKTEFIKKAIMANSPVLNEENIIEDFFNRIRKSVENVTTNLKEFKEGKSVIINAGEWFYLNKNIFIQTKDMVSDSKIFKFSENLNKKTIKRILGLKDNDNIIIQLNQNKFIAFYNKLRYSFDIIEGGFGVPTDGSQKNIYDVEFSVNSSYDTIGEDDDVIVKKRKKNHLDTFNSMIACVNYHAKFIDPGAIYSFTGAASPSDKSLSKERLYNVNRRMDSYKAILDKYNYSYFAVMSSYFFKKASNMKIYFSATKEINAKYFLRRSAKNEVLIYNKIIQGVLFYEEIMPTSDVLTAKDFLKYCINSTNEYRLEGEFNLNAEMIKKDKEKLLDFAIRLIIEALIKSVYNKKTKNKNYKKLMKKTGLGILKDKEEVVEEIIKMIIETEMIEEFVSKTRYVSEKVLGFSKERYGNSNPILIKLRKLTSNPDLLLKYIDIDINNKKFEDSSDKFSKGFQQDLSNVASKFSGNIEDVINKYKKYLNDFTLKEKILLFIVGSDTNISNFKRENGILYKKIINRLEKIPEDKILYDKLVNHSDKFMSYSVINELVKVLQYISQSVTNSFLCLYMSDFIDKEDLKDLLNERIHNRTDISNMNVILTFLEFIKINLNLFGVKKEEFKDNAIQIAHISQSHYIENSIDFIEKNNQKGMEAEIISEILKIVKEFEFSIDLLRVDFGFNTDKLFSSSAFKNLKNLRGEIVNEAFPIEKKTNFNYLNKFLN